MNILTLGGLNYHYGKRELLKDIYIQLETAQIASLLGRNGSGKSTLLHILAGHLSAKDSCFRLNDTYLKHPTNKKDLINICPQFSFIPENFSVRKIFDDYHLQVNDFNNFFFENSISVVQKFGDLSGGVKRLLELFIVIKSKTLFTILDEPFSSLMPIHIEKIIELIQLEKERKGFLISDHFYEDVMKISNLTYYLKEGKTRVVNQHDDLYDLGYIRRESVDHLRH